MARKVKVRLHSPGIREVAKSPEMERVIEEYAEHVAHLVEGYDIKIGGSIGSYRESVPVEVDVYETDRVRASVTLAHPAGLAIQAKYGALTKAASEAGLELGGDNDLLEYVTKSGKRRTATRAQVRNWTQGRIG